jgi:hypothetical protein
MTGNSADNDDFHAIVGIFYMPQICQMEPAALLPLQRKAEDFFTLKNPTASAGFEPANLGTTLLLDHRNCFIQWLPDLLSPDSKATWTLCQPLSPSSDNNMFINCNCIVTRWQWLFTTYTQHEIGWLINLRRKGYMSSM